MSIKRKIRVAILHLYDSSGQYIGPMPRPFALEDAFLYRRIWERNCPGARGVIEERIIRLAPAERVEPRSVIDLERRYGVPLDLLPRKDAELILDSRCGGPWRLALAGEWPAGESPTGSIRLELLGYFEDLDAARAAAE